MPTCRSAGIRNCTFERSTNRRSSALHRLEEFRRKQCVNRAPGLAQAQERDDAALRRRERRKCSPAVGQQAQVARELALQELERVGSGDAQYAEERQRGRARRVGGFIHGGWAAFYGLGGRASCVSAALPGRALIGKANLPLFSRW